MLTSDETDSDSHNTFSILDRNSIYRIYLKNRNSFKIYPIENK